jgi:hypothetical protein
MPFINVNGAGNIGDDRHAIYYSNEDGNYRDNVYNRGMVDNN